jgi:flagellin-specific chaperone FliS
MINEEILFLDQLIKSLEEAEENLEDAYEEGDNKNFNKVKKIMLRLQYEISEILK